MILKYEKACVDAGLTEEEIIKIRRVFDNEKKATGRRIEKEERDGIMLVSLSAMGDELAHGTDYDIPDESANTEQKIIISHDLEILQAVLDELVEDDRIFLLAYFDGAGMNAAELARMYGLKKVTGYERLKKLMEKVRSRFFEMCPEDYTEVFGK